MRTVRQNPAGKWDLLLGAKADAISLEESKKGFTLDIENIVKNLHGSQTVLGNLDAINLLPDGSEKALRADVQRQIEAGRGNGSRFIMGIGSPITPGTSLERVKLYLKIVAELGQS
jgi:uroporphyrinogen-III decarboxylase